MNKDTVLKRLFLMVVFFVTSLQGMNNKKHFLLSNHNNQKTKKEYITSRNPFFNYLPHGNTARMYKNILYAELPINYTQLRAFPLAAVRAKHLREFIIAYSLSQLYKVQTTSGALSPLIASYILQYIPITALTCGLKYEKPKVRREEYFMRSF